MRIILAVLALVFSLGAARAEFILVQSTTSTENSGLFDHILPQFTAEEADTLGSQAQERAEAIAGQITQAAAKLGLGADAQPFDFVFHGGSGSEPEAIREAIGYGVVKMNIDTDMQWAFWEGVLKYYKEK